MRPSARQRLHSVTIAQPDLKRASALAQDEAELDREELEILPTDNLVITAKTEDDVSQLEAHVYDEGEENLYVHHDLMLPSFPLCLEWLDFPPGYNPSASTDESSAAGPSKTHGSYIAVGTFEPEIEIWSLDTVDGLYPDALLGRPDKSKAHVPTPSGTGKKKKRTMKERVSSTEYHVDAVLGLSWNKSHRSMLASASADKTVKLWDLSRESTAPAIRSFDTHTDKVQAVEWSSVEPTVLLTGSYDRTVRMWDTRTPKAGVGAMLGSDVEAVRWDPFEGHGFYVRPSPGSFPSVDRHQTHNSLALPPFLRLSGLARVRSRPQLRLSNTLVLCRPQEPARLNAGQVHPCRSRGRGFVPRRVASRARLPRDGRNGQARQGLEH